MARRVLFFTTSLGGGGAESHTLRVMNGLDRSRYVPSLAVTRRGGSYETLLARDIEVHDVGIASLPSSLGRLVASAPRLARLVHRMDPDVVVSVMDTPNLVALATLARSKRRFKLVACVQIPPSIEYATSRFGRMVLLPGIAALYPRADLVIALSNGVKRDLLGLTPRLEGRVSMIHNACLDSTVDDRPSSGAPDLPATAPVVLAAGRLVPQKGYDTLLDAFARVVEAHDAELWILGEGPLRNEMEERIARLGLGDRARLLGFMSNPRDFMRRATVFALSSVWEGFGNVIVEAMACGAPVVSTDCPHGPAEILEHERSGLLVPVGDSVALAAAIGRVLSDPALRARLSAQGRERAMAFDARTIAAAYADELDRVVG